VPRGAVASSAKLAPQRVGRRRTVLWSVLVALLASVALAGGWWLGEGRYTDAPAVLGLPTAEAAEVLQAAGFTVDYLPEAFDEQVPPQHVLDQDPDPTQQVRKGGTITLQASKGQDRREVPVVAGVTQEDATAALEEVGLQVGTITRDYADAPAGTVVASAPAAGEPLRPDAAVDLVVSRGQELLPVPDVTGQPREEAAAALEAAGFGNEVTEVFSESVGAGVVVAQDPSSGQAVRGASVALQVSKGPELVPVPDVTGDPRADAKRELEALGLVVREFAIPGPGRVRSTDPGAGAEVRKGSTVRVYIF
jgi:serine/threonine-protein kinase